MKEMRFSIEIHAGKERVWNALWGEESFREWAGIIDPGTRLVGELKEGREVEFISGNGYGVTSLVEKMVPNEFLFLRHRADTQEMGAKMREDEWTGGAERYELSENGGVAALSVAFDVPEEMEEYFKGTYPKALARIKELAERDERGG